MKCKVVVEGISGARFEQTIEAEALWEGITLVQRIFRQRGFGDEAWLGVYGEDGELEWDTEGWAVRPVPAKRIKSLYTETYEVFGDYIVEFTKDPNGTFGEHWEAWLHKRGYGVKSHIMGSGAQKGISVTETWEDFKATIFKCIEDDIEFYRAEYEEEVYDEEH